MLCKAPSVGKEFFSAFIQPNKSNRLQNLEEFYISFIEFSLKFYSVGLEIANSLLAESAALLYIARPY